MNYAMFFETVMEYYFDDRRGHAKVLQVQELSNIFYYCSILAKQLLAMSDVTVVI